MVSFAAGEKDDWDWTLMIMTPDWITQRKFNEAVAIVKEAKNPTAIDKLQLQTLTEGTCVQIMHVGAYDNEAPTLAVLHEEWLPQDKYKESGKHHEIYISDPRKTTVEKLTTVRRQPIKNA